MKFGQWLFVSMCLCACLGAAQAVIMAETLKERSELKLMPVRTLPVNFPALTTASDRLAGAVDELKREYGNEYTWALLMREAARVKHEG